MIMALNWSLVLNSYFKDLKKHKLSIEYATELTNYSTFQIKSIGVGDGARSSLKFRKNIFQAKIL